MSASREKKQRQGKAAAAQSASGKGKTVAYAVLAVVIVVAVVALLVWNSGLIQGRTTAVTVGDRDFKPAQVEFYYHTAYYNEYIYSVYGMSQFDSSVDPKEQTYSTNSETGEVTTYHDYFLQTARDSLVELTALLDAAKAEGFTMTAEGSQSVKDNLKSLDESWASAGYSSRNSYLRAVYGPYMSYGAYKQCVEDAQLASDYYLSKGEALTYDDAALDAYYAEHAGELDTLSFSYLFFSGTASSTTDADGNTVDPTEEEQAAAMDAAKSKAQAALEQWRSGSSFDAVKEASEPSTSASGSNTVGSSLSSQYSEWLLDSARQEGEIGIVEGTSGYYVIRFEGRALVQDPTVNIRHILIKAETPEDDPATEDVDESQNAPSDEQMAAAKEEAERIYEEWKNGEATEDSFAALANEYSDDTGSNTNGGLYEQKANGYFVPSFNDWCFDPARQPGDTGLVENDNAGQYGYHIIYFQGYSDPVWKVSALSALKSDDMQTWMTGIKDGLTAVDGAGIKYVGN